MKNQLLNIKKRKIWRSLLAYPAADFLEHPRYIKLRKDMNL
jgi:hypothetical protein